MKDLELLPFELSEWLVFPWLSDVSRCGRFVLSLFALSFGEDGEGLCRGGKNMVLYHGSKETIEKPRIIISRNNKDFYYGFYCTLFEQQAVRWAKRFGGSGFLNMYEYSPNDFLKIKQFPDMSEEWLDFIVSCRLGNPHDYDIVEGPMANDTIFNYVQNFIDGKISRDAFWALAKFKYPTHQISFHTDVALKTLKFIEAKEV